MSSENAMGKGVKRPAPDNDSKEVISKHKVSVPLEIVRMVVNVVNFIGCCLGERRHVSSLFFLFEGCVSVFVHYMCYTGLTDRFGDFLTRVVEEYARRASFLGNQLTVKWTKVFLQSKAFSLHLA